MIPMVLFLVLSAAIWSAMTRRRSATGWLFALSLLLIILLFKHHVTDALSINL